jgi:hypothetical protein
MMIEQNGDNMFLPLCEEEIENVVGGVHPAVLPHDSTDQPSGDGSSGGLSKGEKIGVITVGSVAGAVGVGAVGYGLYKIGRAVLRR